MLKQIIITHHNVKCSGCCKITFAFSLALSHSSSYFSLTVSVAFTTAVSAAVVNTASSQPEPMLPLRDQPVMFYTYPSPVTHGSGYLKPLYYKVCFLWCLFHSLSIVDESAAVSTLPHSRVQCPSQTGNIIQEPLNLSNREKPRSPLHKANGRIPGSFALV